MNLKNTGLALLLFCSGTVAAQQAYWQQKVDNNIIVKLDDQQHMLHGHISIRYHNNAPDTLRFIYFHLYPNAYANDRTAFEKQMVENGKTDHYFADEDDRGYIDSLKFTVSDASGSGIRAGVVATKDIDVVRVVLPEPLAPGSEVTIETPFRVKIPLTFSRLGHEGQAYQVSQWFPKPAVYDAKGWHQMPYLDQGEFYSEYGSYHVEITLPENYIVMGTGNILEEKENTWLDSLSKIPAPAVVKKNGRLVKDTIAVPSALTMKTVTFEEDNVHDFAWFADKKWLVRKDTVLVPGSGNVVTAYSCYNPRHSDGWGNSIQWIKDAICGYSSSVGPYPYKTVKAVEGALNAGGGMEYPTVTVIASANSEEIVKTAIVHEVGHNWFYGMLGTHERQYPWMDEGINSFYDKKFAPSAYQTETGRDDNYMAYATFSATHDLNPADTVITVMPEMNTLVDLYGKAAYHMGWLEAYMGKERFDAAMQDYFRSWQYKHPQPSDFEVVFRKHSPENLDWFFNEVMRTTKPIDFAITGVSRNGVTVRNKTGVKAPVQLVYYQKDSKDSSTVWTEPFTGKKKVPFEVSDSYERIKIADAIPDYNIRNNENKRPLALKGFLGTNLTPQNKIWFSPALGYNYYDGFMAGLVLHNLTIPQHKFQFLLAPMYGFGSSTVGGTGVVGYTAYFDKGGLHDIQFNVEGKTFSYDKTNMNIGDYLHNRFVKVAPEVIFNLRKPEWRSTVERSISLKGYWIREELFAFNMNPADSLYYPTKGDYQDNFYGRLRYQHRNERTFNPFSYTLEGQMGKQYAKLSLEANLRIDYFKKNKALYVRAYAGKFFNLSDNEFDAYRYRIANTYSGQNDYLYDETYIGRSESSGTWSQQISMKEGGFKVNTMQYSNQLGMSDDWLVSLNLKSDLPFWKLPVRLFLDVATFSGAKESNPSGATVLYEAGVELYISDYFSLYLPLLMSKDFKDYTQSVYPENRFFKTISFSLNVGNINWLKLPGKIWKM